MREIKFRVWNLINKCWIDVFRLTLAASGVVMSVIDMNGEQYGLHQIRLVQYTGLKDKNSKEIYESDIVTAELSGMINYEMKSVVDYENGCFGIRALFDEVLVDSKGKFKSFDGCATDIKIEIIGNIYENPELINT